MRDTNFSDHEINMIAPTDDDLRAFIEGHRLEDERQEALADQYEPLYLTQTYKFEVGQRVAALWVFKNDGSYRNGTIKEELGPGYVIRFDDSREEFVNNSNMSRCVHHLYDQPQPNTECTKCGNLCPSGTLPNGLCNDCDLIGKTVNVAWGKFGIVRCLVSHVSKNGTLWVRRWNVTRGDWTAAQPATFYKGVYYLKRYLR